MYYLLILNVHLVVLHAQDKQQDRRQPDSAAKGSTRPPAKFFAAPDADISSDETHPQQPLKADLSDEPAYEAPAKSGGSELFDALLMAATGKRIICVSASLGASRGMATCNLNQLLLAVHFPVTDTQERGGSMNRGKAYQEHLGSQIVYMKVYALWYSNHLYMWLTSSAVTGTLFTALHGQPPAEALPWHQLSI